MACQARVSEILRRFNSAPVYQLVEGVSPFSVQIYLCEACTKKNIGRLLHKACINNERNQRDVSGSTVDDTIASDVSTSNFDNGQLTMHATRGISDHYCLDVQRVAGLLARHTSSLEACILRC